MDSGTGLGSLLTFQVQSKLENGNTGIDTAMENWCMTMDQYKMEGFLKAHAMALATKNGLQVKFTQEILKIIKLKALERLFTIIYLMNNMKDNFLIINHMVMEYFHTIRMKN